MAEILFAARDLPSGYKRGDAIVVVDDGWIWGTREGLPDFWRITVPFTKAQIDPYVMPLIEASEPGDPNFDAIDVPDRVERRHRASTRFTPENLTPPKRNELLTTGLVTLNAGQTRSAYKRLIYDKTTGQVEVSDQDVV